MAKLMRPDVPQGPLDDLLRALHELHLEAGYPSTRTLRDDIGRAVASHTAIHQLFTSPRLPAWGLVELIVEAMARRAQRNDVAEIERLRRLWTKAAAPDPPLSSAQGRGQQPAEQASMDESPALWSSSISELLPDVLDEIEAVGARSAAGTFRIPTGFSDLDALLGGWARGCLVVVGGRPSSGKTTLMLDFCRAASIKYKLPSMLISAETNTQELQTRVLSAEARVPWHSIRTGQMQEEDWLRLAHTMVAVADAPIRLAHISNISLDDIRGEVTCLVEREQLKILFIDGLHSLINRRVTSRLAEAESFLSELKCLAETLKLPIIVSAYADRPKGSYISAVTRIDDLNESDAIEKVADIVVIINRPDQDDRLDPRAGEADLMVEKNRNGPTATATVCFQAHYSRFVDMAPGEYPLFVPEQADSKS